ncbi:hypothetical protein LPJ61_001676 [Coemansia biformis]|uniref:Uncharacterized protein n=1 Tax=Coemansia biformis TaxID=1286918 RepID=A0A9W7YGF6_9FUNG|nr:hypothetical protein LPJ61_001676 [Coemansia biformis]
MCDADTTYISLVKYESGLGRPGIVAPRISSSVEISTTGSGGTVVKWAYENNIPSSKQEGVLGDEGAATVLGQVDALCALPVKSTPGGPDVFGANTVVVVRKGKDTVWWYNPGAGCAVDPDAEAALLSVPDDHRATFVDAVSRIHKASEDCI